MPDVIAISESAIEQAADRLRAGAIVALPTEAGYEAAAAALHPEAVEELRALVGAEEHLAIGLAQATELFDWLPHARGAAVRLARTFWPGPLVLVSSAGATRGLARRLPVEVQAAVVRGGALALRLPDQDWTRALRAALVLAPLPGFPQTVEQIAAGRARLDLIVDGGPSTFVRPPTVVRAGQRTAEVLREGALAAQDVAEVAAARILFVCTGNTCRSPLAEALCRKLLADTLAIEPGRLDEHGFRVQSAGLAAMMGNAATAEAAVIAGEHGADLGRHASQPLNLDLLAQADRVFAMTASHQYMLHSLRLEVGPAAQLLSPDGADVDDPIGSTEDVYRACAADILAALRLRLPELLES